MPIPLLLLGVCALCWLLGSGLILVPIWPKRSAMRLSLAGAVLGGVAGCVLGAYLVQAPGAERYAVATGVTVRGLFPIEFELYLDPLAGLFVFLLSFFAILIGVYSYSYLIEESNSLEIATVFNLHLFSLLLVVVSNNVFYFLVAWESMTLTSVYFVSYRHNKMTDGVDAPPLPNLAYEEALTSPKIYLIASHISTLFVLIAMLGLAQTAHSYSFADFRTLGTSSMGSLSWIYIAAFTGFGIKAAMVPFHVWLPYAHPTSPANIHAMMSGVMVKLAIYGMFRMFFEFLVPGEWWWGALLLVFASGTAFLGVLYAIFQSNLKTALAYHSIENIGIILAGLGLALIARSATASQPDAAFVASLALVASLYHLINHAVFKGLLFLCTGVIERLTGTVEMELLGGLSHRFPWTTALFVTGALAIAGFPPLNGFASEWLLVQSLFASLGLATNTLSGAAILVVQVASLILLSLAFALTAFCFCKILGTVFFGCRRSESEEATWAQHEVAWSMRGVLVVLAGACLLLGLYPDQVVERLASLTDRLMDASSVWFATTGPSAIQFSIPTHLVSAYRFDLQVIPVFMAGLGLCGIVYLIVVILSWRSKQTRPPIWTCASPLGSTHRQFSEINFAYWVFTLSKGILNGVSPPVVQTRFSFLRDELYHAPRIATVEVFRRGINQGLEFLLSRCEAFGLYIQNGDVRTYLLYVLGIVIFVFLFLIQR